jgi:hypothetical protein
MKHVEDHERRIENDDHLGNVLGNQKLGVILKKADESVEPEEDWQKQTNVLSDHPDFSRLLVVVANSQVIQSPEKGKQQRYNDADYY